MNVAYEAHTQRTLLEYRWEALDEIHLEDLVDEISPDDI